MSAPTDRSEAWTAEPTSGGDTLIVIRNGKRDDGQCVALVYRKEYVRLIAAAPELVAILKRFVTDHFHRADRDAGCDCRDCYDARALLARVRTGR